MTKILSLCLLLFCSQVIAEVEMYNIDDTHSFANWRIRHVASKTSGTFSDITGKLMIDRHDLEKSSIKAKINVFSVNSSHAKRDAHIKEKKYLDAAHYGEMHFVSTKIEANSETRGVVTGQLTMHGVTKEISFPFELLGFGKDPFGGYRTGLEAHTVIKASDYGFGWGTKSNASVGDAIEVTLLIEGVRYYADHQPLTN